MIVKDIIDTDIVNYKDISMFIIFPICNNFKCGKKYCQNSKIALSPNINISIDTIINRYISNPLTNALVCGGLEPFDSWEDLYTLVTHFKAHTNDFIIIYTGYMPNEIKSQIKALKEFSNIIIKFGRFVPNQPHHYDKLLGVELTSPNQYAERIS